MEEAEEAMKEEVETQEAINAKSHIKQRNKRNRDVGWSVREDKMHEMANKANEGAEEFFSLHTLLC